MVNISIYYSIAQKNMQEECRICGFLLHGMETFPVLYYADTPGGVSLRRKGLYFGRIKAHLHLQVGLGNGFNP